MSYFEEHKVLTEGGVFDALVGVHAGQDGRVALHRLLPFNNQTKLTECNILNIKYSQRAEYLTPW